MRQVLASTAAVLTLVCVVPYVRAIRRGTTRPQRTSWLTFALLSVTASVAQFADGAQAGALLGAGAAVGFSSVFVLSIRHGVGGRSGADLIGLCFLVAGVTLWAATDRPAVAVTGVVVAELVAGGLTVRKAASDPGSETLSTWVLDGLAGGLAMLASDPDRRVELLYPLNHLVVNAAVALAIVAGRRRRTPAVAG
jgi:hypothetical protein